MRVRAISLLILLPLAFAAVEGAMEPAPAAGFSFFVAADMREYSGPEYRGAGYFKSACEAMKALGGEFLVSPGDVEPPQRAREVVTQVFGAAFPWYPAVGNHDLDKREYIAWLREFNAGGEKLPGIVRKGPAGAEATMYAFDHGNAHFVVLNEYYDGSTDAGADGDVSDATYLWLERDLAANAKPLIFVFGHEPAFPLPDMDTGKLRHADTSLNAHRKRRDRFWKLLAERKVTAFICGHTHTASAKKIDGVWQLDSGHARGKGDASIPSTFLRISIADGDARFEIHRADRDGLNYRPKHAGSLVKDALPQSLNVDAAERGR